MKIFITLCFLFFFNNLYSQTMQATIRKGSTPRTVDIYLKPSASFSQKDEAMTLSLAIPATVQPAPSLGASGTTSNSTGVVSGITGLVPNFLVDKLESTQREVYISKEKINGEDYYVYAFIFATTATANHDWVGGTEQLIFSIQFNGCKSNCDALDVMLVNLPNGGAEGRAYWYFQPNTLGDITNYQNPFYQNEQTKTPLNGGSADGSALSMVTLSSVLMLPVGLKSFNGNAKECNARLDWKTDLERNLSYYGIERSKDGMHFFEISKVQPHQGSNIEKEYTFTDDDPDAEIVYYRLRMVDKDGQVNYSNILPLKFDCIAEGLISIYPTRSPGLFNFRLPIDFGNPAIKIFNASGQLVKNYIPTALAGTINLSGFPSGIYMVKFMNDGNVVDSKKIIIAK